MDGGVTVAAVLSVSVLLWGFFLQADNKNTMRFSIFHGPGWETDRASKGSPVAQYFKRKWVSGRLLEVNYVSQTMGLTEMLNETYQLTIHSHSCRLCVVQPRATAVLPRCCLFLRLLRVTSLIRPFFCNMPKKSTPLPCSCSPR